MLVAIFSLAGCLEPPPTVPPPSPSERLEAPVPEVPLDISWSLPTRSGQSPASSPLSAEGEKAKAVLTRVVQAHGRTPLNGWAIGHGLLALGPEMKLDTEEPAIPFLFENFAERKGANVAFPKRKGSTLIEPHSDLMLKVFGELGLPLDTTVTVDGKPATLLDLYRHSVQRTWVTPTAESSFPSFNDSPWALQGLATYAPKDFAWKAEGRSMDMNLFTEVVAADLFAQTRFMAEAKAKGEKVEKKRQGIFAYTCGGQHLLQGVAYAVARGFGSELAAERVDEQVHILFWRLDVELEIYDTYLKENPKYAPLLIEQRLKFLGHFVESTHKLAALGIFTPDEAQRAAMDRAREELIQTVLAIEARGFFNAMNSYGSAKETKQMYLDYVGDSAHALRGLHLSTGEGSILY